MDGTTEYTIYAGSVILRTGSCDRTSYDTKAGAGETIIEGIYPDDVYYMVGGDTTLRPTFDFDVFGTVPVNIDLVIVGIPTGVTVYTDGFDLGATDGTDLEWSSTQPGTYTLRFSLFPYIDKEVQVEVTP